MQNLFYVTDLGPESEFSPDFNSKKSLLEWCEQNKEKYGADFVNGVPIYQNNSLSRSQITTAQNGNLVIRRPRNV